MEKKPLYSIGHGSRKLEDFQALLERYKIQYLIDVRSQPQSRFHPQFNRQALAQSLQETGVTYVFMGDTLGGRPKDTSCYDSEGRIDYDLVQKKTFYRQGIERLKTAYLKNVTAAIMCSERNPLACHRSRLIGKTLQTEGITMQHIDETGKLKSQDDLFQGRPDLFTG